MPEPARQGLGHEPAMSFLFFFHPEAGRRYV
jgi:hypothetical protein